MWISTRETGKYREKKLSSSSGTARQRGARKEIKRIRTQISVPCNMGQDTHKEVSMLATNLTRIPL